MGKRVTTDAPEPEDEKPEPEEDSLELVFREITDEGDLPCEDDEDDGK